MRTFRHYEDDTLHERSNHWEGELVGRKPIVFSFLNNRPKKTQGAQGAATRMGRDFLKKLERLGLR
jgi:hypothetical protein